MTAPTPDAERVQGEANQGIGWYEFITPKATTRIAYVGESGYLYLPEGDPEEHFHLASAEGRAHRLIRADSLDVEEMARAADPKAFEDHPIEARSHAAAIQWAARRKIATDHARAIRAALLGSTS